MGVLDLALLVCGVVGILRSGVADFVRSGVAGIVSSVVAGAAMLLELLYLVLLALFILVLLALVCCCNAHYQCQDPTSTTRLPATDSRHLPGQSCLSLPSS